MGRPKGSSRVDNVLITTVYIFTCFSYLGPWHCVWSLAPCLTSAIRTIAPPHATLHMKMLEFKFRGYASSAYPELALLNFLTILMYIYARNFRISA